MGNVQSDCETSDNAVHVTVRVQVSLYHHLSLRGQQSLPVPAVLKVVTVVSSDGGLLESLLDSSGRAIV